VPRFAANLTMLFGEVEFLDRFALAARAGFRGVEYLFPYGHDKRELAEKLQRHELTQVLHNLPPGDWDRGERGIACLPGREREFQDGVGDAIEYATALGCRQVNCLAGIAPASAAPEVLRATFVENLRFAARALGDAGIKLLIEPINSIRDIPGFYLDRSAQALDIISEVGSDNLYLQYDVYHMHVMGEEMPATIERHLARIAHVQIADDPGRHEPGTGSIDFAFLFRLFDRIGYAGWIGCEYKPSTTTDAALEWLEEYRQ
jgi:hydroxypyruvate isomerase